MRTEEMSGKEQGYGGLVRVGGGGCGEGGRKSSKRVSGLSSQ